MKVRLFRIMEHQAFAVRIASKDHFLLLGHLKGALDRQSRPAGDRSGSKLTPTPPVPSHPEF